MGLFLCLQFLYITADATEVTAKEPIQIIETQRIIPDYKILLNNEVRYTRNWDDKGTDDCLQITYQDAQLLLMVASAEAANQGTTGMLRVMQCIVNRVRDDDFPSTIESVVFQPGRFESVTQGTIFRVDIPGTAHEALALLEGNKDMNVEIIGFETSANGRTLEKYFNYSFTYQDHDFYIKKQ